MPDQPRTIEIHELVYGSAARLLEPGASDLGVIASTRDFPSDIARRLASHRGFTPDSRVDGAVKYIVGVLGGRLEFTRIQMGTDHTGRTIPFARHLLLPLDGGNRWGDLVHRAEAHAQDPRRAAAGWITPSPRLSPTLAAPPPPTEAVAKAIATAAEAVMQYPQTKRPVLLVHVPPAASAPENDPFVAFVAAIGDVLPQSALAALVAVTHAIDPDDRLAEASVFATYPGTPFHQEMVSRKGSRRPLVIDLAQATLEGAPGPASTFIKVTTHDLMAGRPGRFAGLCDRLGAKPELWPLVADVYRALSGLEAQPTLTNAEAFLSAVKKAGGGTAGAALDRGMLLSQFVKSIGGALNSVARDASGQADGVGRLGQIIRSHESLQEQATKEGIAALRDGARSIAETLARALAVAGPDAITVARHVAGDRPAGRAFAELVDPPTPVIASGSEPPPAEIAERKQKPQRRDSTTGPRVPAGTSHRLGHGGTAAIRSPWWSRLIPLVLFAPALFGIGWPVWSAYSLLPEAPEVTSPNTADEQRSSANNSKENADSKTEPVQSQGATHPKTEPVQSQGATHLKAFYEACKQVMPRPLVPGILCIFAFLLLVCHGHLTRATFTALQPFGGGVADRIATVLPGLVLLAASVTGCHLGYSARLPENGDAASSTADVQSAKTDHETPQDRRPNTQDQKPQAASTKEPPQ